MSTASTSRSIDWSRYARHALLTIGAAILANVVIYFLGALLIGYDPEFIVLANVSGTIIFTVVPAIIAVLLYAILLKFTRNPARIFTIIAVIVLLLSVIPDFAYIPTVPGSSPGQTAVLVTMHMVAAAVIVGMLTRFRPSEPISQAS